MSIMLPLILFGSLLAQGSTDDRDEVQETRARSVEAVRQGDPKKGVAIAEAEVKAQVERHGEEHRDVARALCTLVERYRNAGRYEDAEKSGRRGLAILEKTATPPCNATYVLMIHIAYAKWDKGNLDDAVVVAREAIEIGSKLPTLRECDLTLAKRVVSRWHAEHDRPSEALKIDLENLRNIECFYQKSDIETIRSLMDLSGDYFSLGRLSEAESLQRTILSSIEQNAGIDPVESALGLENLCMILVKERNTSEVEGLALRALAIREKAQGRDHFDLSDSLQWLAEATSERSDYPAAEKYALRLLSIREKHQGPDHPDLIPVLRGICGLYEVQGKGEKMEPAALRFITLVEKAEGADSPSLLPMLDSLSQLYLDRHRLEKATTIRYRAERIRSRQADPPLPANTR